MGVWVEVIGGWTAGPGLTLLEPSGTIPLRVTIVNDEESQDAIVLGDGFFRRLSLELKEPRSGEVVATLKGWRDLGWCAGIPDCPINVAMTLGPGEIAQFEAVLSTSDKKPPALGVYDLRVVVGEARQRVMAANGSAFSGLMPDATNVPLELRKARSAYDFRALENQELAAVLDRNDHAEALRIHQRQIARDPSGLTAHGEAGRALAALGRLSEAAAAYERALALAFSSPSALSHSPYPDSLATVYFALGDDSKARATLRRYRSEADAQSAEKYLRQAASRLPRR